MQLQEFEISSFRGATKPLVLKFDPEKKITMLYGENGNGKSTISDALICLFTESNGSLDDRSSTKIQDLVSIDCGFRDVLIKLTTDAGVFSAAFNDKGTAFVKQPDANFPVVRHLRRSQITRLIDAEPAERYNELRSYIEVSNIEVSENVLRSLCKNIKQELDTQKQILLEAKNTLQSAWNAEGKPLGNSEEWAKSECKKDLKLEEQKFRFFDIIRQLWFSLNEKLEDFNSKKALKSKAVFDRESAEKEFLKAQRNDDTSTVNLIKLLNDAKNYVEQTDPLSSCPVCENQIQRDILLNNLVKRVLALDIFQELLKRLDESTKKEKTSNDLLENSIKVIKQPLENWINKMREGGELLDSSITDIVNRIEQESQVELRCKILSEHYSLLVQFNSKSSEMALQIKKTIDQYNLIKKQIESITESQKKVDNYENLRILSEKTLKIFESERKDFVTAELKSISTEVDSLYQSFHPNERLGGVKLFLKSRGKASLELNAGFFAKLDITPQSLYSESHLDTLGICIFLALAKKYNQRNTILLLDDIVMSVDHEHLERFIKLLHDESKHFIHLVITTHYRPWRDMYRFNRAPDRDIHFIELRSWTLERGILIQDGRSSFSDLKEAIESDRFDRNLIANRAGILLESILDFLTLQLNCKLSRKTKSEYTLGELLNGISKKLLPALKVEHFIRDDSGTLSATSFRTENLREIIEELRTLAFIRNQVGAHFNLGGSEISDREVLRFGELSQRLGELLICPESGTFPYRKKSGSYHESRTGNIRLHPLQEPS